MSDTVDEILHRVSAFKHFRDLSPDKGYTSPEAQDAITLAGEVERLRRELAEAERRRRIAYRVVDLRLIAALPQWPDGADFVDTDDNRSGSFDREAYLGEERHAALARLALARDFIAQRGHDFGCDAVTPLKPSGGFIMVNPKTECSCGVSAMLAALEVPRA